MSRDHVVQAYSSWHAISRAEAMCLGLAFRSGARVLDLGCGAGRVARYLAGRTGGYLGVDASPQMVEAARKNCPDLEFVVGNIVDFVAEPASFDVVLLMGNVLDYLCPEDRRERLLEQCVVWLRPAGVIVGSAHLTTRDEQRGFYTENYHGADVLNFRSSLGEIVAEVESHGFEVWLALRDDRLTPADWAYWVARTAG